MNDNIKCVLDLLQNCIHNGHEVQKLCENTADTLKSNSSVQKYIENINGETKALEKLKKKIYDLMLSNSNKDYGKWKNELQDVISSMDSISNENVSQIVEAVMRSKTSKAMRKLTDIDKSVKDFKGDEVTSNFVKMLSERNKKIIKCLNHVIDLLPKPPKIDCTKAPRTKKKLFILSDDLQKSIRTPDKNQMSRIGTVTIQSDGTAGQTSSSVTFNNNQTMLPRQTLTGFLQDEMSGFEVLLELKEQSSNSMQLIDFSSTMGKLSASLAIDGEGLENVDIFEINLMDMPIEQTAIAVVENNRTGELEEVPVQIVATEPNNDVHGRIMEIKSPDSQTATSRSSPQQLGYSRNENIFDTSQIVFTDLPESPTRLSPRKLGISRDENIFDTSQIVFTDLLETTRLSPRKLGLSTDENIFDTSQIVFTDSPSLNQSAQLQNVIENTIDSVADAIADAVHNRSVREAIDEAVHNRSVREHPIDWTPQSHLVSPKTQRAPGRNRWKSSLRGLRARGLNFNDEHMMPSRTATPELVPSRTPIPEPNLDEDDLDADMDFNLVMSSPISEEQMAAAALERDKIMNYNSPKTPQRGQSSTPSPRNRANASFNRSLLHKSPTRSMRRRQTEISRRSPVREGQLVRITPEKVLPKITRQFADGNLMDLSEGEEKIMDQIGEMQKSIDKSMRRMQNLPRPMRTPTSFRQDGEDPLNRLNRYLDRPNVDYLDVTPNLNSTSPFQRSAYEYRTPRSERKRNASLPSYMITPQQNFQRSGMDRSLNYFVNEARNRRIDEEPRENNWFNLSHQDEDLEDVDMDFPDSPDNSTDSFMKQFEDGQSLLEDEVFEPNESFED